MNWNAPSYDVFLLPGELHVGTHGERVHTLLGSCVAVTMWSRRHHVGAICHYVLPRATENDAEHLHGHYGDRALSWLLEQMQHRGIGLSDIEAKIIGGGAVLDLPRSDGGIGCQNVALARHFLKLTGVAVVAEDIGRSGYRRLIFDITDGSVWVKHTKHDIRSRTNGE